MLLAKLNLNVAYKNYIKKGLHERVSLNVLLRFGSNPKWLLLGFMGITAFMSLWISNAASCSMMLPIVITFLNVN